jgi:hypothetical protein
MASAFPPVIKYKTLRTRHDSYMQEFWQKCKALYAGGPTLLNNTSLLKLVMPMHAREMQEVYDERLKRAFYIPYPGAIIDSLIAQLMSKPLTFELEESTANSDDGGVQGSEKIEENLPLYYRDLVKNCSKTGAKKLSLNQFARDQISTALKCQTAWALVDMPKAPSEGYLNRAEQDKAGGLNAYICQLDPECVVDWEEREDGELTWVLIQDIIARRDGIDQERNMVTIRWRYYREEDWAIYELTYDKKKKPSGPTDTDEVKLVDQGKHSFQRVPVRRMRLPDGLWAMGKLEAMARAHLNQRNALSWGQLKALFPVPVLYVQNPDPKAPVSEDVGRVAQQHGQGFLRVFAENDRLEYFSPDTAPYQVAGADLNVIRDEMHRVLHSMAQSVDNSGAALQRSGESKAIDQAAAAVILRALGTYIREHLEDLLLTISTGRKDNHRFCANGMDNFDDVTLSQLVLDAVGLASVGIESAKFNALWKFKIAKLALGADATEDDLREIKEELEQNVTQDQFAAEAEAKTLQHEASAAVADATTKDPQGIKASKALGKSKSTSSKKSAQSKKTKK